MEIHPICLCRSEAHKFLLDFKASLLSVQRWGNMRCKEIYPGCEAGFLCAMKVRSLLQFLSSVEIIEEFEDGIKIALKIWHCRPAGNPTPSGPKWFEKLWKKPEFLKYCAHKWHPSHLVFCFDLVFSQNNNSDFNLCLCGLNRMIISKQENKRIATRKKWFPGK